MNHRSTRLGRRRWAAVLVGLGALAASTLSVADLATAAPPAAAPAITIVNVHTPTITVPNTPGAGAPFVVQDIAFDVDIATSAVVSANKATDLLLTVESGPNAGLQVPGSIGAGATTATISGVVLADPADDVRIKVAVNAKNSDVVPDTEIFSVLQDRFTAPSTSALTGFGGGGGVGVPCSPTSTDQVCGDVKLNDASGVLSDLLLARGASNSFLQVLVEVDPVKYNRTNPIVVVAKCDKSKCGGSGIKKFGVFVQIRPTDPLAKSLACAQKGVVDAGKDFCTDYVQSTRDNAGDLLMVVLLRIDAKIIF